jgi:tRNA threonylcarbamoyl adenosine modification protein YeaZ
MKFIAWDTSSKSGALVAMEGNDKTLRLVTELSLNVEVTHSERLLWGIHQLLQAASWKLEDVDYFGVGVGPGSFTGLRVGITTARTLSHSLNKPLIGVSSLAALARPAAIHFSHESSRHPTWVVATTDACKGELFALWGPAVAVAGSAIATEDEPESVVWKPEVLEQVVRPEQLIQDLKKKLSQGGAKSRWIAIGEGRQRYLDFWEKLPKSRELTCPYPYSNQIQGRYLGLLVGEAIQAGLGRNGLQIHPRYLRASDAELKLKAGLLAPSPREV